MSQLFFSFSLALTLTASLTTTMFIASASAANAGEAGDAKHQGPMQISPAPLVSVPTQDAFFDSIRAHCGKAYEGKVVVDNQPSSAFDARLVMFVRRCTDSELQVPFYVGDDASRTWILTKTGSGISLKHDHRHADGSHDAVTMYGGHTLDAGYNEIQSFPVDEYSKQLFAKERLAQSITNTWQMYIYPDTFSYRLVREGREFRVDFDLTKPIPAPSAPWGYAD